MKLIVSDAARDCWPEQVELGVYDAAQTARIKARVMGQIAAETEAEEKLRRRFTLRKVISTVALVAALLAMLTVTAYAVGLFRMNVRLVPAEETVAGEWIERDAAGNITHIQPMRYADAGLVLTYEAEGEPRLVTFRPSWLPNEPTYQWGAGDGWFWNVTDDGEDRDGSIPYQITLAYAHPDGYQLVLLGESEIVKEDTWGELQVVEVDNRWDSRPESWGTEHYIILFNAEYGYMAVVGGSDDLDTLEHIARELEFQVSEDPVEYDPDYNIGIFNVGRG